VGGEYSQCITDRGLQSICATNNQAAAAAIEKLTLCKTKVTDEGLEVLSKGLKCLRYLDVRGCPVSKNGVSVFKSDNEHCEVISDLD